MAVPEKIEEARYALGRHLARLRQAAGYSQHEFASLVHYGRSTIANVEVGRQNASRKFWVRCDDLMEADGALTAGFDAMECHRNNGLRRTEAVPASHGETLLFPQVIPELDAPFGIVQRMQAAASSNVDEMTLGALEDAVAGVIRDYERLGPHLIASRVIAWRGWVHQIMQGRQPPKQAARLYLSASRLTGVLAVIALDVHRYDAARAYAVEAFHLATLVDEPDALAWVRATQSLIEYYAGDYRRALSFATDGQRVAPGGSQSIRLAINGEARAQARLGDHRAAAAAVDRAMQGLAVLPERDDVSCSLALDPYCPARVSGNAATTFLLLGDGEQVMRHGQTALAVFDHRELRGPQALTRLDMASALLREAHPQPEHAASLVAEALAVEGASDFASVAQRAGEFLSSVGAWQTLPAIRDVAVQVRELTTRNG